MGLGNPAMGDDGVAWRILDRLAADPRLPEDTDVLWAGGDLLRCASSLAGRTEVTFLDAMLDAAEPGSLRILEHDTDELDNGQSSVHQLSAVEAVRMLRALEPSLATTRLKWMLVGIEAARVQPELSASLAAKLPELVERVLEELG